MSGKKSPSQRQDISYDFLIRTARKSQVKSYARDHRVQILKGER